VACRRRWETVEEDRRRVADAPTAATLFVDYSLAMENGEIYRKSICEADICGKIA